MQFKASPAALDLCAAEGRSIKPTANWTAQRRRYRRPTEVEAKAALLTSADTVVCDEGLLFVNRGEAIEVRTLKELGLR